MNKINKAATVEDLHCGRFVALMNLFLPVIKIGGAGF